VVAAGAAAATGVAAVDTGAEEVAAAGAEEVDGDHDRNHSRLAFKVCLRRFPKGPAYHGIISPSLQQSLYNRGFVESLSNSPNQTMYAYTMLPSACLLMFIKGSVCDSPPAALPGCNTADTYW
jgi:hypothetical protein